MDFNLLVQQNWGWFILLGAWSLVWKGWALWIAARREQKVWFVALLILNTVGILEIFYIFYFSKQPKVITTSAKK